MWDVGTAACVVRVPGRQPPDRGAIACGRLLDALTPSHCSFIHSFILDGHLPDVRESLLPLWPLCLVIMLAIEYPVNAAHLCKVISKA